MLCCRMETSSFCALPAWPGVILREKGLKSASGDSTGGNKALLAAGWAWKGSRTVAEGGSGALPSCLGCFLHLSIRVSIDVEKPVAKAVLLPPLSRETGSVSWDYIQHLKENIYRIYIHIPFALFSGGSPVPSLPPARTSSQTALKMWYKNSTPGSPEELAWLCAGSDFPAVSLAKNKSRLWII